MDVREHISPEDGRHEVPLTRRQAREARLAAEDLRAAEALERTATSDDQATRAQPLESRRARRLREQSAPVAVDEHEGQALVPDPAPTAEDHSAAADLAPDDETPQVPIATDRFRFDVGTIPLAPHSATRVALSAPTAPNRAGDDLASDEKLASATFGRMARRSFVVALSAASVVGLTLTATLPALAPMSVGGGSQATAIQRLSLGNTADSEIAIDFVEGVDGVEVEAEAAVLSADTYVNNPNGLVQFPFSRGVPLTDGFGYRTAPVAQFHDAQDFAAGNGAAIRSIADGVVTESGETTDGCGTGVKIAHKIDGLNVTSRYCHMQVGSEQVGVGDQVTVGEMVGRVGSTGMSFGAHLHLALQVNGEPVDPMPFITKYNAISR